jgi:Arc/MetJ-type ribon-helix-helix transcriptional regulator
VKSINVESPGKIAVELTRLVERGWFRDEGEAVRVALGEFNRDEANGGGLTWQRAWLESNKQAGLC